MGTVFLVVFRLVFLNQKRLTRIINDKLENFRLNFLRHVIYGVE